MADDKEHKKDKVTSKPDAGKAEPVSDTPPKTDKKLKGKDKEKEPKKERKEIKLHKKDLNLKPDFKYVVRIANTDIDGTRTVSYGLTKIDGIGIRIAEAAIVHLNLPSMELLGNLSDEQIISLESAIQNSSKNLPVWILNRRHDQDTGNSSHIFGTERNLKLRDDINMMKMIRCYKGIRHETGQKVRGQRTKSNGRSGLTVGVTRKAILAAAKASKETESEKGGRKPGAAPKKEAPKE